MNEGMELEEIENALENALLQIGTPECLESALFHCEKARGAIKRLLKNRKQQRKQGEQVKRSSKMECGGPLELVEAPQPLAVTRNP